MLVFVRHVDVAQEVQDRGDAAGRVSSTTCGGVGESQDREVEGTTLLLHDSTFRVVLVRAGEQSPQVAARITDPMNARILPNQ